MVNSVQGAKDKCIRHQSFNVVYVTLQFTVVEKDSKLVIDRNANFEFRPKLKPKLLAETENLKKVIFRLIYALSVLKMRYLWV